MDRSQSSSSSISSVSERRLGNDRGKLGNLSVNFQKVGMESTAKDTTFWKWGVMMMSGIRGRRVAQCMVSQMTRGTALARSRLNAATRSHEPDINVQFSGVDTMDSRQYRHTWVRGTIGLALQSCQSRTYRATLDSISGGSLFTGCNTFRRDGINPRTSRALVSRLSICTVHWN